MGPKYVGPQHNIKTDAAHVININHLGPVFQHIKQSVEFNSKLNFVDLHQIKTAG